MFSQKQNKKRTNCQKSQTYVYVFQEMVFKDLYQHNHCFPLGVLLSGTGQANHFKFGLVIQKLLFEKTNFSMDDQRRKAFKTQRPITIAHLKPSAK